MNSTFNVSMESEGTVIPLPKDKHGFLHLYALDKELTKILMGRDNREAYKIFDVMKSSCIVVNALNMMRKRDLPLKEAIAYCEDWAKSLPWVDYIFFDKKYVCTLKSDFFSNFFLESLVYDSLTQTEECFKKLYEKLLTTYTSSVAFEDISPDQTMVYQYLNYAFRDLSLHWESKNVNFIAPIFQIRENDRSKYGSLEGQDTIATYEPTYEKMDVYEKETGRFLSGYLDKDGHFHVSDENTCCEDLYWNVCNFPDEDIDLDELFDDVDDIFGPFEGHETVDNDGDNFFSQKGPDIFDPSQNSTFQDDEEDLFSFATSDDLWQVEHDDDEEEDEFDDFFDDDEDIYDEKELNNMKNNTDFTNTHNKGDIISIDPFQFLNELFDEADGDEDALFEVFGPYSDEFFEFYENFTAKTST